MRAGNIFFSNRGSVTILAIGVMMFLGIILSGVLPMITQEVRSGTVNRDVIEAQYAAETGLKRAVAALATEDANWAWITTAQTVPFTSEAGKTYKVSLQADSPQTLTDGVKPVAGWYYLQSEGRVNNALKKIMVKVQLTTGGGLSGVYANGVFGTAAINMNNSIINGSAGTNTTFTGWNSAINGDLLAVVNNNSRSIWQKVSVTGTTTDITSTPPAVAVPVPTFSTSFSMPSAPNVSGALAWPVASSMWQESGVTILSGVYKLTGEWTAGQSTVSVQPNTTLYATTGISFHKSVITMGANSNLYSGAGLKVESNGAKLTTQANTTFYVVNQMALSNSAIVTMGDNAVLCIGGGLKLDNGSVLTTQGKTTIYVNGDLELANGGTAINFGGDTELFIGGRLVLSNPSQISTAANSNVVIKANSISMANSSSVSSGTGSSLALLAETTITMSNTASIGNALVMAKGDISIQGGSITGAVISTGAVVKMDGATVNYDPAMVNLVLVNNPSLATGGGATSISTSEWKNY